MTVVIIVLLLAFGIPQKILAKLSSHPKNFFYAPVFYMLKVTSCGVTLSAKDVLVELQQLRHDSQERTAVQD
jgi:hypothetical protein